MPNNTPYGTLPYVQNINTQNAPNIQKASSLQPQHQSQLQHQPQQYQSQLPQMSQFPQYHLPNNVDKQIDMRINDVYNRICAANSCGQTIDKKIDDYVAQIRTLDNKLNETRNYILDNDKKVNDYFTNLSSLTSNRCKTFDEQFKNYEQYVIDKYNNINNQMIANDEKLIDLNKRNGEILELIADKTNSMKIQAEKIEKCNETINALECKLNVVDQLYSYLSQMSNNLDIFLEKNYHLANILTNKFNEQHSICSNDQINIENKSTIDENTTGIPSCQNQNATSQHQISISLQQNDTSSQQNNVSLQSENEHENKNENNSENKNENTY